MLKKKSAVLDVSLRQIREQLEAKAAVNSGAVRSSSSMSSSSQKKQMKDDAAQPLRRSSSSMAFLTGSMTSLSTSSKRNEGTNKQQQQKKGGNSPTRLHTAANNPNEVTVTRVDRKLQRLREDGIKLTGATVKDLDEVLKAAGESEEAAAQRRRSSKFSRTEESSTTNTGKSATQRLLDQKKENEKDALNHGGNKKLSDIEIIRMGTKGITGGGGQGKSSGGLKKPRLISAEEAVTSGAHGAMIPTSEPVALWELLLLQHRQADGSSVTPVIPSNDRGKGGLVGSSSNHGGTAALQTSLTSPLNKSSSSPKGLQSGGGAAGSGVKPRKFGEPSASMLNLGASSVINVTSGPLSPLNSTVGGGGGSRSRRDTTLSSSSAVLNTSAIASNLIEKEGQGAKLSAAQLKKMSSIGGAKGGKAIDMTSLINKKKLQFASIDSTSIVPSLCFKKRLLHWGKLVPGLKERFLRWEIVKMTMVEGLHDEGIIQEEGEGRAVCIPLKMSSLDTADDSWLERQNNFLHEASQIEIQKLWREISYRGGIQKPTYFALSKEIICRFFVHLNEREIHQLILQDLEVDLPGGGIMNQRCFLRWITSITMVWLESHAVGEVIRFLQALNEIWKSVLDKLDLTFYTRYSRKDPSPLVPSILTKHVLTPQALIQFCSEQLALTVKVRFGMLLSNGPVFGGGKVKKRKKPALQDTSGWDLYLNTEQENVTRLDCVDDGDFIPPSSSEVGGGDATARSSSLNRQKGGGATNSNSNSFLATPKVIPAGSRGAVVKESPLVTPKTPSISFEDDARLRLLRDKGDNTTDGGTRLSILSPDALLMKSGGVGTLERNKIVSSGGESDPLGGLTEVISSPKLGIGSVRTPGINNNSFSSPKTPGGGLGKFSKMNMTKLQLDKMGKTPGSSTLNPAPMSPTSFNKHQNELNMSYQQDKVRAAWGAAAGTAPRYLPQDHINAQRRAEWQRWENARLQQELLATKMEEQNTSNTSVRMAQLKKPPKYLTKVKPLEKYSLRECCSLETVEQLRREDERKVFEETYPHYDFSKINGGGGGLSGTLGFGDTNLSLSAIRAAVKESHHINNTTTNGSPSSNEISPVPPASPGDMSMDDDEKETTTAMAGGTIVDGGLGRRGNLTLTSQTSPREEGGGTFNEEVEKNGTVVGNNPTTTPGASSLSFPQLHPAQLMSQLGPPVPVMPVYGGRVNLRTQSKQKH